jgi:hypothetical protein
VCSVKIQDIQFKINECIYRQTALRSFSLVHTQAPSQNIKDNNWGDSNLVIPDAKALEQFLVSAKAADPLRFPDLRTDVERGYIDFKRVV